MWSRSAKSKQTEMFTVECHDWNGALYFKGEFASIHDADKAGESAERKMTFDMQYGKIEGPEMSIDDILAELEI